MSPYQTICPRCGTKIAPDRPCEHVWMNERGQVYQVHPVHQFEPEPAAAVVLVCVCERQFEQEANYLKHVEACKKAQGATAS